MASKPCELCQNFFGTAETQFLCSTCFRTQKPEAFREAKSLEAKRRAPVFLWTENFKRALVGSDIEKLKELGAARQDALARGVEGETDDQLGVRHAGRMEVVLEEAWTKARRDVRMARALLESGLLLDDMRKVIGPMFSRSGGGPTVFACFDYLCEHDELRALVNQEDLKNAIYTGDTLRDQWLDRLLSKRFTGVPLPDEEQDVGPDGEPEYSALSNAQLNVTKNVVEHARYLMSRANGGASKDKRRFVGRIERAAKRRTQSMAARRKQERAAEKLIGVAEAKEPSGGTKRRAGTALLDYDRAPSDDDDDQQPRKRRTRASTRAATSSSSSTSTATTSKIDAVAPTPEVEKKKAVAVESAEERKCERLAQNFVFPMNLDSTKTNRFTAGRKLELWTCGLRDTSPETNHDQHDASGVWAKWVELCAKLERQLESWKPSYQTETWRAFVVPRETIAAAGVEDDWEDAGRTFMRVLDADYDETSSLHPEYLQLKDTRKTFFHRRFYYDYRVDTKRLAKVKAATNQIKRLAVKNSCVLVQLHEHNTEVFDPCLFICGRARNQAGRGGGDGQEREDDGALVVVQYHDLEQDHYHHGSI